MLQLYHVPEWRMHAHCSVNNLEGCHREKLSSVTSNKKFANR